MAQFTVAGDFILNMDQCTMVGLAPDVQNDMTVYAPALHFPGVVIILEPYPTKEEAISKFFKGLESGNLPAVTHIVTPRPSEQIATPPGAGVTPMRSRNLP